ncbi:YhcN/YlaJ family sporulation lipoprotein [Proteiniborus sp.]|uniref:YhcN/YlaJ family sporulation lipoprotein n=1 Tax=Proteiniborus sp. TaxID=2079015 RepID=UPI00332D88A7
MRERVNLLHIITAFLFIILVASGCQTARKPGPNISVEEEKTDKERKVTESNQEVIKGEVAADALVDLSGIDDATVVFSDNQAIVAVIVSEGEISEDLKRRIIDTIKDYDENINRINITADKNLFYRLDDIQQSLIRGEQNRTISEDIKNILSEINNKK